MTQEKPFSPRILAEALDYYAGADFINAINTAKAEARAEGKTEANMDNARKMKAKGYSAEDITDITGLAIEGIEMF